MHRKLRILYHLPNPDTIYAGRTIYFGYKHAFEKLGHEFKTLTADSDQSEMFLQYKPDIFMTSIGPLIFKYLDLQLLKKAKKQGTKVFVNTPFWKSPFAKTRVNEVADLSENKTLIKLISSPDFGDVYYNICEAGDTRMEGFSKTTGYNLHTVLLAADSELIYPDYSEKFVADISFIGTYLPGKSAILNSWVKPLSKKCNLKIYGQDWTLLNRALGMAQRVGQYFNVPVLKNFLKQPLMLSDERKVYASSKISINLHEEYQKQFLGDINERTFKIPLAGGFEITDAMPSLQKYFKIGEELVVAENKRDWFEKIGYYLKHPAKRRQISEKGRKRVLKEHTYGNRVLQLVGYYGKLK